MAGWFRQPTSGVGIQTFEKLRNEVKVLDQDEKELILVGDTSCEFKCNQNSNATKLNLIYSEFQLEQLFRSYKRAVTAYNKSNGTATSKTLIDHFSSNKSKYILKEDTIET